MTWKPTTRAAQAERQLKLSALFEDGFILSDVQVIESRGIVPLFGQADFRLFVQGCPDFLALRVRGAGGVTTDRFTAATRGLVRVLQPGWRSSWFSRDATPLKRLAEAVLDDGGIDLGNRSTRLGRLLQTRSPCTADLEAVAHAVAHFATPNVGVVVEAVPQAAPMETYYSVLGRLTKADDLPEPERESVVKALAFVDENVNGQNAKALRSNVVPCIDFRSPEHRAIWGTIVNAWNFATETTVASGGGSAPLVGDRPVPGVYLSEPAAASAFLSPRGLRTLTPAGDLCPSLEVGFSIDDLTWDRVREVRNSTASTRLRFIAASVDPRASDQDLRDALDAHVAAMANEFMGKYLPLGQRRWGHLVGTGLAFAGLVATYLFVSPNAGAVLSGAAAGAFGGNLPLLARHYVNRWRVVRTLRQASVYSNPTRESGLASKAKSS